MSPYTINHKINMVTVSVQVRTNSQGAQILLVFNKTLIIDPSTVSDTILVGGQTRHNLQ